MTARSESSAHAALAEADRRARARACTEFERPLMLAAGAGTGKTTVLVARCVAWLVGPGWDRAQRPDDLPERTARLALAGVVAITFTEAAASEMQQRLVRALSELARGTQPLGVAAPGNQTLREQSAQRARSLLEVLDVSVALTIHAFCRRILARFPFAAHLAPGFEVDADGRKIESLARELVDQDLRQKLSAPIDADALRVLAQPVEPEELVSTLVELVTRGIQPAALADSACTFAHVTAAWELARRTSTEFLGSSGAGLAEVKRTQTSITHATLDALQILAQAFADSTPADLASIDAALAQLRPAWTKKCSTRLQLWSLGIFNTGETDALEHTDTAKAHALELYDALETLLEFEPLFFEAARRLLGQLLTRLRTELDQRGLVSFGDLLEHARGLLCNEDEAREQLSSEIQQLLVDEFQDTDRLQCEIVGQLAFGSRARPGLFVVGDPKQSIYAWRSADLEAYEGFQRRMRMENGLFEELSQNHRSTDAVLSEVERAIAPIMQARAGVQPAFEPLLGARAQNGVQVEAWVAWERAPDSVKRLFETSSRRAREIEAGMIAERCATLRREDRDQGREPRRVALLLRAMSSVDIYLSALRARGIPYTIVGDKNYWRRREVLDAAAWVSAVLDSSDTLALFTALRSPVCGVPDAAWMALWCERLPELAARLEDGSSTERAAIEALVERALPYVDSQLPGLARLPQWHRLCIDGLCALGELRQSFRDDPADVFLERLFARTRLVATEAARHLGRYRVANLERFERQLAEIFEDSGADTAALLRLVRGEVRQERAAEEARVLDAAGGAIEIMTIHKSKGLDFDCVFLADMHSQPRRGQRPRFALRDHASGTTSAILFGVPGPGARAEEERKRTLSRAESVRLLYVALTRAKDQLVLSGRWPEAKKEADLKRAASLLDLWLASAEADWFPALSMAAEGGSPLEATKTLAFKLPESKPKEELGEALSAPDRVDFERATRDAGVLARAQAAAQKRMLLPLIARASELAPAGNAAFRQRAEGTDGASRAVAREAGTLLHGALERAHGRAGDLALELETELERDLAEAPAAEAEHARALCKSFRSSPMFARWEALAPHVIARELPLLGPAILGQSLAATLGSIDMLYRDPADGALVIADYKSERIADPSEIPERAVVHAPQLEFYRAALAQALDLATPPRAELWFLDAGVVHVL